MKVFVSSYAAASAAPPWDKNAEAALFDGLSRLDLAGLELPFYGRLHAHDENWLLDRLRPDWRFVVTVLPGTMEHLRSKNDFGLASADPDGRRRALDFADGARRAVERLNAYLGFLSVSAVAVHSAPRLGRSGARSSPESFAESLTELRRWDWSGAELLVEHCDALVPEHEPDKGFLSVEAECAALGLSRGRTPARLLINWGRSAVETRSPSGPLDHIRRAVSADLLAGVFFSGATPAHPDYGAWKDSHAPFSTSCPESLLTPSAAREALAAAGKISYLGLKIQPLPASLDAGARLAMIRDGLDALTSARA